MNPIFVYGTLKRGGRYHSYLAGQQFLTTACTIAGHTLYQPADYPAMVLDDTDRKGVTGEVWQVNAACLQALDQLEGVHEHLYARKPVKLVPPHAELTVESYFYLRPVTGHPHLGSTWP
ncbi:MAG: gamma-glutamylcyclotransferase [Cephaloticoccus sp.]|nr:gamma-glutamylcyclotransferase [Cephaloticoccus sp.]MCF7759184.1 gamma-glutamylcyclotransferase [Cephaloticoccus sp.]